MEREMKTNQCIYCGEEREVGEFTFEHVIPKSLGGAYAPDKFKTHDVCKSCNNELGQFVDAAFEKDWFVQGWFSLSARAFFDAEKPTSLPLICMGPLSLILPGMTEQEVCESWLGPFGEQIYWVRPKDEGLYWYVGGNPRTTKEHETRAYFYFSERSVRNPELVWRSFRDAFKKRKKVRKILDAQMVGDFKAIGFSEPDELDNERLLFLRSLSSNGGSFRGQLSLNVNFDRRFMAKLALGVGYCLFGRKILETEYGRELRKGVWYQEVVGEEDEEASPQLNGMSMWGMKEDHIFSRIIGNEHAVSLVVVPSRDGVAVNINIGNEMSGIIKCASLEDLTPEELDEVRGGIVILLFKHIKTGMSLSLQAYLAHKSGSRIHPRLAEIDSQIHRAQNYFQGLNGTEKKS